MTLVDSYLKFIVKDWLVGAFIISYCTIVFVELQSSYLKL